MFTEYFKWEDEFSTGIDIVDSQHSSLIETVNYALQISLHNEKISFEDLSTIKAKLQKYAIEHFDSEEALMLEKGVDNRHISQHFKAHASFAKTVDIYFQDQRKLTDPNALGDVIEYLVRWLAYHILNTDKSMARQISYITTENMSSEDAYNKEKDYENTTAEPLLKALKALFIIVSEKNIELAKRNEELEIRVKERTLELEKANKKLQNLSIRDELTGLRNRRYADSEISLQINNYRRYNTIFSLLFIDVDKFKSVNDIHGHDNGDKVLKWISTYIKSNIRKTDIPCRIGGDEFVVICSHSTGKNAMVLANKLAANLANACPDEIKQMWSPSISIGVTEISPAINEACDLLGLADGAMYESKKQGGGRAHML